MREFATDPDGWLATNSTRLGDLQRSAAAARAAIASVRGHARSDDGTVTVVVNSVGEIETLDIGEGAMSRDRRVLSSSILSTLREAKAAAAVVFEETMQEIDADTALSDVLNVFVDAPSLAGRPQAKPRDEESEPKPWGWDGILERP